MRFSLALATALLLATPHLVEAQMAAETVAAPEVSAAAFVTAAAQADMVELGTGRLALTKTQSEDVKQFAQQVIDDHTQSSAKLKEAAAQARLPLPTGLAAGDQDKLAELKAAKPEAFDGAYLRMQVAVHERAVTVFRRYAEAGTDATLKAFAADSLPVLEAHLRHAKGMAPGSSVQ